MMSILWIIIFIVIVLVFVAIARGHKHVYGSAKAASSLPEGPERPAKLDDVSPGAKAPLSDRWRSDVGRGSSSAEESKEKPSVEGEVEKMLQESGGPYRSGDGVKKTPDGKN